MPMFYQIDIFVVIERQTSVTEFIKITYTSFSQISLEVDRLSMARFLPRPPNHHRPLSIETPNFHPCTSTQWLLDNGLRARNLNLYQVRSRDSIGRQ